MTTTIPPRPEEHADPSACPPTAGGRRALRGAEDVVGRRYGQRTVLADLGHTATTRSGGKRERFVRVICDCGSIDDIALTSLRREPSRQRCRRCGDRARGDRMRGMRQREAVAIRARVDALHALLDEAGKRAPEIWRIECSHRGNERCERCEVQVEAIAELVTALGPMTLSAIGALHGYSREYARQIEAGALERMRAAAQRAGLEPIDERSSGSWDAWGASAEASAEMGW